MSKVKKVLQEKTSKSAPARDVLFSNTDKEVLKNSGKPDWRKASISEIVSQKEPLFKYRLYEGKVFEPVNLEEELFTNFLPPFEAFDGYIEEGLKKLKTSPQLLSHTEKREKAKEVQLRGEFEHHIENIISQYDFLNNDNGKLIDSLRDGFIRKSKIESPLGDNGALRLISVYSKDIEKNISYFDLLFIDFYHLFIPSKHNGLSARENAKKVYADRKNHKDSVHKYLSSDVFEE